MFLFLASVQKRGDFGNNSWFDLLDKPGEWFDFRESKQNGSVTKLFLVVSICYNSVIHLSKLFPFFFFLIPLSTGES